ncbi:hypothetical protein EOB36_18140 [Mesorhizobium sp. M6A.T.Cr.TU.017.01.1.1]|uniref:hypothetical protein n=1 Tax=Mesorhizobium sp. M6A.T.Cr.TU.017.01.1.1 TaxID=2496774 RepID=UPI000FD5F9B3|nr:hypothetical protein [Mesorhizobium sp. M6A.T.Cr.TU.017.01.1.1]RUV00067.1 hypothetical protein EOB36_18140 [Mesorhizobium sp. M6A.T.Cr.TU.017.01.1.1]
MSNAIYENGDSGVEVDPTLASGLRGAHGWSMVTALIADGERRVRRVVDWTGGEGLKPDVGGYLGPLGLVTDIGEATDDRGPKGEPGEGEPGLQGKSAYQIAVDNGFVGTELEWLNFYVNEIAEAATNEAIDARDVAVAKADQTAADVLTVEEAKNIVLASGGIPFETTALGIAATTEGQLFEAKGVSGGIVYKALYKNVAGVATAQNLEVPSKAAFDAAFDLVHEWVAFGGALGFVLKDKDGKIYAAWRQDDALLRTRLGLVSESIDLAYDEETGLTTASIPGLVAETAEQIINGKKALLVFKDPNDQVFAACMEDGSLYVPRLAADRIIGASTGTADSSSYYFAVEDIAGVPQIIRYNRTLGTRTQITSEGGNTAPRVTQDGLYVVYASTRTNPASEFFQPVGGGDEIPVIAGSTIIAIGNSLSTTGGQGYISGLIPLRPGVTVHSEAVSGQRSDDIGYRLGALPFTGSIAGDSIPPSGGVTVTGLAATIWRYWGTDNGSLRVEIAGVPGTLSKTVSVYTFTRDDAGSAVPVINPVIIVPKSGIAYGSTDPSSKMPLTELFSGTVIVWATYNDHREGTYSQAATLANIAAIVNCVRPLVKKVLVACDHIGFGRLTDATAQANGAGAGIGLATSEIESKRQIQDSRALTAAILAAYPGESVDLQTELIADGYTQDITVLGTVFPIAKLSLFGDGTHPTTALGRAVVAGYINDQLTSRGI